MVAQLSNNVERNHGVYTAPVSSVWFVVIVASAAALLALALIAWLLWRHADPEARTLVQRVSRLPLRAKLRLAVMLVHDRRIPLAARAIPPLLVLYLAMPLDVIPDFIPVLGQVDDMVILVVGVALLLRFIPRHILAESVNGLEMKV